MFLIEDNRLVRYEHSSDTKIIIPEGVTTIGTRAFENHPTLADILFPSTIKTVGDGAFEGCAALESVSFREGVKRLGNGCFRNCAGLRSVYLPDTVASIHPRAFQGCESLAEIRLSKGLRRNIEGQTFGGCVSLKSIVIPAGIEQIKGGAFSGCTALEKVTFENPYVQIEPGAFTGCGSLCAESLALIEANTIDKSAIDIKSQAPGAIGRLSNYTARRFVFDGISCGSLEGVLQSLKCPDPQRQAEICALAGGEAKHAGSLYDWKAEQTLYWQGRAFPRQSDEYQRLLDRLYLAVYEQDEDFRRDISGIKGKNVDHRMGLSDPEKTVLTRQEFVRRLKGLSEETLRRD